jgi:hypothetical protein
MMAELDCWRNGLLHKEIQTGLLDAAQSCRSAGGSAVTNVELSRWCEAAASSLLDVSRLARTQAWIANVEDSAPCRESRAVPETT